MRRQEDQAPPQRLREVKDVSVVCIAEVKLRGRRWMEDGSNVELMLLTSNSCIHLSKTQGFGEGFATPSLKIAPESLVASDFSL